MNYTATLSILIGYLFVVSLSIVVTTHVIRNRKNYGTPFMGLLIAAVAFLIGCVHATLYTLSIILFISEQINIFLWKLSIIVWFIILVTASSLFSSFREYKKIKSFPFLFYTLFFGLLIGVLLVPDSITLTLAISHPSSVTLIDPFLIKYSYNFVAGVITILFQVLVIFHFLYITILINVRSKKREETLPLIMNAIIFSIPIILNVLYIIFHQTPFKQFFIRDLFIIILWIS
ncbi:MAG: hypothetical protein ACFFDH_22805, partial [Promethearchaeota archaeon]